MDLASAREQKIFMHVCKPQCFSPGVWNIIEAWSCRPCRGVLPGLGLWFRTWGNISEILAEMDHLIRLRLWILWIRQHLWTIFSLAVDKTHIPFAFCTKQLCRSTWIVFPFARYFWFYLHVTGTEQTWIWKKGECPQKAAGGICPFLAGGWAMCSLPRSPQYSFLNPPNFPQISMKIQHTVFQCHFSTHKPHNFKNQNKINRFVLK